MKKTFKYLSLLFAMIFSMTFFLNSVTAKAAQANFEYDYDEINSNISSIAEYFSNMSDDEIQYYIDNYVGMQKEAFESFKAVKEGIGSYSKTEDCKIKEEKNAITAKAKVEFSKATIEMTIKFKNINGGATPVNITFSKEQGSDNTSFGEKMKKAGMNTLLGMGTVFIVLIFLSFVISLFKFIYKFQNKSKESEKNVASSNANATATAEEEELVDDLELIAVITAAIAASEGTSTDGFVVRSIKRVPNSKWKNA